MEAPEAIPPNATPPKPSRTIKGFIFFYSITVLLFSLLIVPIVSFLINNPFSIPNPVSIASQCTIVSTSVDLRSSKVCELGLLNYKAKNVFYPSQSTKFRCRYDYYWASVFKVEYIEYSSGQTRRALAEAPKEALPIDCRPSFGVAWLTKDKFKVNETYNCRYTPGISEVDIYSDSFFNCHAEDPSTMEMIKRYCILLTRMTYSILVDEEVSLTEGISEFFTLELLAGIFTGIFTAFVSVGLIRLLHIQKSRLAKNSEAMRPHSAVHRNHAKRNYIRVGFLVVYLSLTSWLILQCGKVLGLNKIWTIY